jgi:hypothetical protein
MKSLLLRVCLSLALLLVSSMRFAQKEQVPPVPGPKPGPAKPAKPAASAKAAANATPNLADFDTYVTQTMKGLECSRRGVCHRERRQADPE